MGIAERRQREREGLHAAIIDAAVEIVSTQGVDALSVRAVADRIEYSHAAIYLYFKGKDELLRAVVHEAFARFDAMLDRALVASESGGTQAQLAAVRRAYIDFALEHTAYFRLMFAIPGVPCLEPECRPSDLGVGVRASRCRAGPPGSGSVNWWRAGFPRGSCPIGTRSRGSSASGPCYTDS